MMHFILSYLTLRKSYVIHDQYALQFVQDLFHSIMLANFFLLSFMWYLECLIINSLLFLQLLTVSYLALPPLLSSTILMIEYHGKGGPLYLQAKGDRGIETSVLFLENYQIIQYFLILFMTKSRVIYGNILFLHGGEHSRRLPHILYKKVPSSQDKSAKGSGNDERGVTQSCHAVLILWVHICNITSSYIDSNSVRVIELFPHSTNMMTQCIASDGQNYDYYTMMTPSIYRCQCTMDCLQ